MNVEMKKVALAVEVKSREFFLGDLVSAGEQLDCAKQLRKVIFESTSPTEGVDNSELEVENLLDDAFMSIASNNYIEALGHLQAADKIRPGNKILNLSAPSWLCS